MYTEPVKEVAMYQNTFSSLTAKRILISLMLFAAVPFTALLINRYVRQETMSLMVSFNIFGFILCTYDWNLFAIHYNRFKCRLQDSLFYTVLGIILISFIFLVNDHFLNGQTVIADDESLIRFGYARFGMWMAFSYVQSLVISITWKCLTDRITIQGSELRTIILTAVLFGFFYLAAFIPFSPMIWTRTYLYNILLTAALSYLYNQSHTLLPGVLAMGTVYLAAMIL